MTTKVCTWTLAEVVKGMSVVDMYVRGVQITTLHVFLCCILIALVIQKIQQNTNENSSIHR